MPKKLQPPNVFGSEVPYGEKFLSSLNGAFQRIYSDVNSALLGFTDSQGDTISLFETVASRLALRILGRGGLEFLAQQAPSAPPVGHGTVYWNPSTNQPEAIDSSGNILQLVNVAASQQIPAGSIFNYGGGTAPSGFVLCDGTSYTTAGQAALFAAIGYAYGGSGANFNVPDFRDNFAVGAGSTYSNGNTGGAASHTLTIGQIPAHDHTGAPHTHSYSSYDSGNPFNPDNSVAGSGSGGATATPNGNTTGSASAGNTGSTGGGGSFPTIPPYVAATFIIKT